MTLQELMNAIGTILPEATLEEDEDGQIVINTNLRETTEQKLVSMDET